MPAINIEPLTAPYKIILLDPYRIIYDQSDPVTYSIIDGKLSLELNEPESLEFTLAPDHPSVNLIEPYASYIRVLEGDKSIFYGRVVSKSTSKVTTLTSFQCSGALSFLDDSEVPPNTKDASKKPQAKKMKAKAFFEWCIEQHNDETLDDRRYFTVGTINVSKKNEEDDYTLNGYTQTKSAITSNLVDVYGGYLRVRDTNGYLYIDWIEQYETVNSQRIEIGVNVQEQTNQSDGTNMFTLLRPIGDNGITISDDPDEQDSDIIELYPDEDLEKYGRIVKSITFSANTKAKLRTKANAYKSKIQKTLFESASVNWIDMHYLDGVTPRVSLGDRFTNIAGYSGITMVVATMEINLVAPWNNSLELRNKKSLDSDNSQTGHGHSGNKTMSGHSKSSAGQVFKWLREDGNMLSVLADIVDMHGITLNQHYETINTNAQVINTTVGTLSQVSGTVNSHTQKINDLETWVDDIEGTGFYQNRDQIWNVAGQFEVWKDSSGKILGLKLKDGADLNITKNGISQTVGTRLNSVYDDVARFKGSALWTNRDDITGVCGEFEVVGSGDNKKLIIKSGGGIQIERDSTRFGLYDEGNLTAGVAIEIINGETAATIKADRIHLLGQTIMNTVDANYIATQIASMANVNVQLLTSERGGISVHSVAADSFYQGDVECYISHAIHQLQIVQDGDGYKLQRKWFSEDEWTDVGSFSRATALTGAWNGGTFTVTASPQNQKYAITCPNPSNDVTNTDTIQISTPAGSKSYILYNNGNNDVCLKTSKTNDGKNYVTVANMTHGKYNAGWGAAYGKVVVPTSSATNTNSITVKTPPSTVDGSADSITYMLNNDSDNAVDLQWFNSETQKYTTVARLTHNKWTSCYNKVGLNYSSNQTINPGQSRTIYPTAAVNSSSNPASITGKGVTVTANTDKNLVAANIKKDVTIFGVKGTYKPAESFSSISASSYSSPQYTDSDGHRVNRTKIGGTLSLNSSNKSIIFNTGAGGHYYISISVPD